jgi:hypothetical protein
MFGRADLGKGPLVNMTDGGDGSSGYVSLPEKNKVHSEFMKGNKNREGKACSEESKIKSSNTNKARYAAGAIHGRKDKSHTAETKKLISDILKEKYENGYVHPQTGIPRTQATKERIKKTKLNKNGGFTLKELEKKSVNPKGYKPVRTPLGEFGSVGAAAKAHNCKPYTISKRLRLHKPGYEHINSLILNPTFMAIEKNLTINQNETFLEEVGVTNSDGTVFDLTGYTVTAQMRTGYNNFAYTDLNPIIDPDPTTGTLTLNLDYLQTAALRIGRQVYDVIILNTSTSFATRILSGIVTIEGSATRS